VRERLVDRELALVREDRLGDQQVGELDDRARLLADRAADLLQARTLVRRIASMRPCGSPNGVPWPGSTVRGRRSATARSDVR
jgi:hypothetical protein